jgi:hypothetical protein
VRVMGFFIESPLLAEVSSLTCNDHYYSFLLIPPCEFRIHRVLAPYRLLSYGTDFFTVLSIFSVS